MGFEFKILDFIQTLRVPILDSIMCFFTKIGDLGLIWIALAIVLLIIPKTRKSGLIILTALAIDFVLCDVVMKNVFERLRPCDVNTAVQLLISRPDGYSFPSGHTSSSFAAVAALFLSGEKRLWKISLVPAILIAFSRMYLYVHFPTDILGGIAVGILSAIIAKLCFDKFICIRNIHFRKSKT